MSAFARATLQRLRYAQRPTSDNPVNVTVDGPAIEVQFNPASLKISRKNNVDRGGLTTGTQRRQHPSQEPATLSFDLEFDTAEQGTATARVDVRDWTALIRQFVEPQPDNRGNPPPAVRFAWGTIIFDGLIDEVTEDLDYFAPDGTPLRAKISIKITEQNFAYEALREGSPARDASAATDPGEIPAGQSPGASGTRSPEQVVTAQDGESAQQLMARLGLDPAAWRAAMTGLASPLALTAGAQVQLGAEARAAGGIGLAAGFTATLATTAPAGLALALGTPASVSLEGGAVAGSAGFTLTAAGGIGAAARAVTSAEVSVTTAAARASFAVPEGPVGLQAVAVVDARATTFGRSVPLRARAQPATLADVQAGGRVSLSARARRAETVLADATAAPWERLPASAAGRGAADAEQRRRDARLGILLRTRGGGFS